MAVIKKITQLDDIRVALRVISSQVTSITVTLDMLKSDVDEAYYAACRELEDKNINNKTNVPLSMKLNVPDAPYAWECGDVCAQKINKPIQ
jgi:hypothetical protein